MITGRLKVKSFVLYSLHEVHDPEAMMERTKVDTDG